MLYCNSWGVCFTQVKLTSQAMAVFLNAITRTSFVKNQRHLVFVSHCYLKFLLTLLRKCVYFINIVVLAHLLVVIS